MLLQALVAVLTIGTVHQEAPAAPLEETATCTLAVVAAAVVAALGAQAATATCTLVGAVRTFLLSSAHMRSTAAAWLDDRTTPVCLCVC